MVSGRGTLRLLAKGNSQGERNKSVVQEQEERCLRHVLELERGGSSPHVQALVMAESVGTTSKAQKRRKGKRASL